MVSDPSEKRRTAAHFSLKPRRMKKNKTLQYSLPPKPRPKPPSRAVGLIAGRLETRFIRRNSME